MEKQKLQPFTIISSPDDKFKVWIRRPVSDGRNVLAVSLWKEGWHLWML